GMRLPDLGIVHSTPKGLHRPAQGCRLRLPDLGIAHSTPKGLRRPAQGCRPRLPWGQAVSVSNPERVASSFPQIAFVPIDVVSFQHRAKFLLKIRRSMMGFLSLNIVDRAFQIRLANRKRRISALPLKRSIENPLFI